MTEPKRFKRGKHTYTKWGPNFKEVRVDGKPREAPEPPRPAPEPPIPGRNDPDGFYANETVVHRSSDEVVLDFVFRPRGQARAFLRSRVVVSHAHVKRLAALLKRASEETEDAQ